MKDAPTPRTDAEVGYGRFHDGTAIPFARQLERELAAAVRERDEAIAALSREGTLRGQAEAQRDEWHTHTMNELAAHNECACSSQMALERALNDLSACRNELLETQHDKAAALAERDEARECLRDLIHQHETTLGAQGGPYESARLSSYRKATQRHRKAAGLDPA